MADEQRKLFFSEKELEAMGLWSAGTLRNHRVKGIGLPYVRVGRTIRYSRKDLLEYLKANRLKPVSREGKGKLEASSQL